MVNSNTSDGYYQPWADQKLEKFVSGSTSAIEDIEIDNENAPVEYYNLQGVKVQNPENGLYIKKQGKKVTKVVL